jgi:hypothetical protein
LNNAAPFLANNSVVGKCLREFRADQVFDGQIRCRDDIDIVFTLDVVRPLAGVGKRYRQARDVDRRVRFGSQSISPRLEYRRSLAGHRWNTNRPFSGQWLVIYKRKKVW